MNFANKTVLLVEDDANDEELFRLALAHANIDCHVDVVRHGEDLLEYLFAHAGRAGQEKKRPPDLILLDLKLPKLNGLQVLQILKNAAHAEPTVWPIVVFTSSDDDRDIASSYGLGALSYVRKPVAHGRFVETVQETVLYWLGINQPIPPRAPRSTAHSVEHAVPGR
ncbi:MAG TPA: response regulator [Pirellulales bacterium]|jgi:two-component system response regulator